MMPVALSLVEFPPEAFMLLVLMIAIGLLCGLVFVAIEMVEKWKKK
jgi:hypothetical protein